MSQATVRISERTRETLREMARSRQVSMQSVLDEAVEELRRRRFIEDLNASYAELRNDPEAWKAVEAERALWDGTLMDGLPEDEIWDPDSRTAHLQAAAGFLTCSSDSSRGGTQDRKLCPL